MKDRFTIVSDRAGVCCRHGRRRIRAGRRHVDDLRRRAGYRRRCDPRRHGDREGRSRHDARDRHQYGRRVLDPRAQRRQVHAHGLADRFQDRGRVRRPRGAWHAGVGESDDGSRAARGDGHRHEQLGAGEHADRDRVVDAQRRSDQPHADADPQRAERGDVPARRQHGDHQPQLEHQRPAGIVHQHHPGRRQQRRQLQQVDRRVLRLRDAAAGRGRGRHRDHRGRRRRDRRQRRDDDQLRHAIGDQPLQRQRLRVLPRHRAELELLVQQAQRPAAERSAAQSVRRTRRRTHRDPGAVRRPRQGVLLRQLRAAALPEQLLAHAHDPASACARWLVPLQRRRPGP